MCTEQKFSLTIFLDFFPNLFCTSYYNRPFGHKVGFTKIGLNHWTYYTVYIWLYMEQGVLKVKQKLSVKKKQKLSSKMLVETEIILKKDNAN